MPLEFIFDNTILKIHEFRGLPVTIKQYNPKRFNGDAMLTNLFNVASYSFNIIWEQNSSKDKTMFLHFICVVTVSASFDE